MSFVRSALAKRRAPAAGFLDAHARTVAAALDEAPVLQDGLADDRPSRFGGPAPAGRGLRAQEGRPRRLAGWRWAIAGGLLGLAGGVLAFAPARWLASAVDQASQGRLQLAEAEGTVWDGRAYLVLAGGHGSRDALWLPERLHWVVRPIWFGLQATARQPGHLLQPLQVDWRPRWGGQQWVLRSGNADDTSPSAAATAALAAAPLGRWPLAWLAGLGTPWNTLQPSGAMQVSTPGLKLEATQGRWRTEGSLALEVLSLQSRLSPLPVLGSYRLTLHGQPAGAPAGSEAARLELQTLEGPLRLTGSGQWSGDRWRFRGQAQADAGHEAALANLLNIIGRRQGAVSVLSIG